VSIQGNIKKRPGPLAPPGKMRPSRKITALSYSFTIFDEIIFKKVLKNKRSKKKPLSTIPLNS